MWGYAKEFHIFGAEIFPGIERKLWINEDVILFLDEKTQYTEGVETHSPLT